MFYTDKLMETDQIMFEAQRKIKSEKKHKDITRRRKDLMNEVAEQFSKRDMGRDFYEPFDPIICEGKLKIDMMYYQQLMERLNDEYTPVVENMIIDLFKTVKEIYEFVNIKPEFFGKNVNTDLLNEPSSEVRRVLSSRLYESLDSLFYKLDPQQRVAKYKDYSKHHIEDMLNEGVDSETAVTFGIKATVMENVLTKISFPFTCWTRVQYLTESQDYGLVFDQDKLVDLVESFEKQVRKLSKVIASCV